MSFTREDWRKKALDSAKWLQYIRLALCDPLELAQGEIPSDGKVAEMAVDQILELKALKEKARMHG